MDADWSVTYLVVILFPETKVKKEKQSNKKDDLAGSFHYGYLLFGGTFLRLVQVCPELDDGLPEGSGSPILLRG